MSDLTEYKDALIAGARQLAEDFLKTGLDEAQQDAEAFFASTRDKLARWSDALAKGKLTKEEFGLLVHSQAALAEVRALGHIGIQQARLERFRQKLVALVIDTAIKVFL